MNLLEKEIYCSVLGTLRQMYKKIQVLTYENYFCECVRKFCIVEQGKYKK